MPIRQKKSSAASRQRRVGGGQALLAFVRSFGKLCAPCGKATQIKLRHQDALTLPSAETAAAGNESREGNRRALRAPLPLTEGDRNPRGDAPPRACETTPIQRCSTSTTGQLGHAHNTRTSRTGPCATTPPSPTPPPPQPAHAQTTTPSGHHSSAKSSAAPPSAGGSCASTLRALAINTSVASSNSSSAR